MVCGNCGRKLKDPVSIKIGYGPVCRAELGIKVGEKLKIKSAKSSSESTNPKNEYDIPGQTSIFDHPDWLPDDMLEENDGQRQI